MADVLFDEMKKLYPDLSDDQLVAKIESVDQGTQNPVSSDVPSTKIEGPDTPITADPYKDLAINQVRQKYLGDKYNDQARQAIVDQNKAETTGNIFGSALASFGTGLAGGNAALAGQEALKSMEARKNARLSDFDKARAAQTEDLKTGQNLVQYEQDQEKLKRETDPNSAESKMAQDLAVQMGVKPELVQGMTAQRFKDLSPVLEKKYQVAEQTAARRDAAEMAADARRDSKVADQSKRANEAQDRAMTSTTQLLESARGNPAAAQAERDIYAADKAKSLANMYGDPNKLSPQQVRLLASEVGKIAQGGVPTMTELEGLDPGTLRGKLASVWQKLSNSPSPANAADFVKQYTDYTNSLTKDAQKVIQDKYGRIIESRKKQLGPDNYQSLQDQYMKRFNPSSTSSAPSMPEQPQVQTKVVGGKTYKKVPGGWQEVE